MRSIASTSVRASQKEGMPPPAAVAASRPASAQARDDRAAALAATLFVALSLVAYAWLAFTFDFPDVLRRPAPRILALFLASQESVRAGYELFALCHVVLGAAILLLARALRAADGPALAVATFGGMLYALTQTIGFLRWPFAVPLLASEYAAATSDAQRGQALLALELVHRYVGMAVGEHLSFVGLALFLLGIGTALRGEPLRQTGLARCALVLGVVVAAHALEPLGGPFVVLAPLLLPAHAGTYAWLLALALCLLRRAPEATSLPPVGRPAVVALVVLFTVALVPSWLG